MVLAINVLSALSATGILGNADARLIVFTDDSRLKLWAAKVSLKAAKKNTLPSSTERSHVLSFC